MTDPGVAGRRLVSALQHSVCLECQPDVVHEVCFARTPGLLRLALQSFLFCSLPIISQHHCRKCGAAVCSKCSPSESSLPLLGYEHPQRVCSKCLPLLTDEECVCSRLCCSFKSQLACTAAWLRTPRFSLKVLLCSRRV